MRVPWRRTTRAEGEWFYLRLRDGRASRENVRIIREWAEETVNGAWMCYVLSYHNYAIFAFADEKDAILAHLLV
jgi:hypothetical protein